MFLFRIKRLINRRAKLKRNSTNNNPSKFLFFGPGEELKFHTHLISKDILIQFMNFSIPNLDYKMRIYERIELKLNVFLDIKNA